MSALLLLPSWLSWVFWEPSNITADGNLWSTKYFFLLPLHLCIPLNCDLVIPRCKSWCCSEITLEGRKLSVLPLIWFTGNCRSWKYLRDYPVYLLIFLDEKTVQGLSNMFRVTQQAADQGVKPRQCDTQMHSHHITLPFLYLLLQHTTLAK